jgi:hypothetical protein
MRTYIVNQWGINKHYVESDSTWFRFCSSKIDSIGRVRTLITVELHKKNANALIEWMQNEMQSTMK